MSNIFDIRNSSLEHQKQYRDEMDRQEKIAREKDSLKLQSDITKRLQDLEATFQKQREIDREERTKENEIEYIKRQEERRKDRWFTAILLVIGAILSGLLVKLLDIFFK